MTELGKALAQLRLLQSLSLEECATLAGTTVEVLMAAEHGDIDVNVLETLARLHHLDADLLQKGIVLPLEAGKGTSVFLLRGTCPALDARDLSVLGWAMRAGRTMTALSTVHDNGEPLRRRMRFIPVDPQGPKTADAARQGHKLARKARAELQLGGEPLGDMRALLEEQLGIAVVVDSLVSQDLRAASILDKHRAAAAVVLAFPQPDLEKNPSLARVFLAHELCHLLFDPGTPGTIRLALDNQMLGEGTIDLLESRAKGFAAEFLIPHQGLCALFGDPLVPVATLGEGRAMVAKTREHFGTPTEIAARHLCNLGFIHPNFFLDLLAHLPPPTVQPITSLPAPSAIPHLADALLKKRFPTMPVVYGYVIRHSLPSSPIFTDPSLTESRIAPSFANEARDAADLAMDDLSAHVLHRALEALSQGREIAAGDALVEHFDDLLLAGEFDVARRFLARLDPTLLPPKVLSGLLMISKAAKDVLGDDRIAFFDRARVALHETWQLRPEQVEAICRRHQ